MQIEVHFHLTYSPDQSRKAWSAYGMRAGGHRL